MSGKIDDQVKRIRERDESAGSALSKPLEAFKAGYHENAIILCGTLIQSILRDIWTRESIPGGSEALSASTMLEKVKPLISDSMIQESLEEIATASDKVDSGEHIPFEDAFEFLRKTCSVVLWYVESYKHAQPSEATVSKKSFIASIAVAVVVTAIVTAGITVAILKQSPETTMVTPASPPKVAAPTSYANLTLPNGRAPETDQDWVIIAEGFIEKNDFDGAVYCLTKAVEKNWTPQNLTHRAVAYLNGGQYKKAGDDAITALKINPEFGYAYYALGEIFKKTNQMDNAKRNFEKACSLGHQRGCEALKQFPDKAE